METALTKTVNPFHRGMWNFRHLRMSGQSTHSDMKEVLWTISGRLKTFTWAGVDYSSGT